jgi:hypothetical protein
MDSERKKTEAKYRKRGRNKKEINKSSKYGKERQNNKRKENKEHKYSLLNNILKYQYIHNTLTWI